MDFFSPLHIMFFLRCSSRISSLLSVFTHVSSIHANKFSMKAYNFCNLDFLKTDFEISRTTSGVTSEANCKFTTFFSVANPLILCAPPQIFIEAERTRSDLAISPTHYSVTMSNTQETSRQVTNLPAESFLVHRA